MVVAKAKVAKVRVREKVIKWEVAKVLAVCLGMAACPVMAACLVMAPP